MANQSTVKQDNGKSDSAWEQCLSQLQSAITTDLKTLNSLDPKRPKHWFYRAGDLSVDLSKTPLTEKTRGILVTYAKSCKIKESIAALINGEQVNFTEQRAAHHSALRDIFSAKLDNHQQQAKSTFNRVCELAHNLREGKWLGATGLAITDVVNIGIGGSDLGPRMVCTALQNEKKNSINVHFAANIDSLELNSILQHCSPVTTLFIISSKSFSTLETLENAKAARRWLGSCIDNSQLTHHLIAISSNVEKAVDFGVAPENILPIPEWVGGRFSLWSAIGLPIAIAHGAKAFEDLLKGAYELDQHFSSAALEENIPLLLAFLDIIYINVLNAQSTAVLPYSHALRLLPDYLQQLCMESNGKSVSRKGNSISTHTSQVIWGGSGTVGQHSFHQLFHQGTNLIPVDFILPLVGEKSAAKNSANDNNRHAHLVANCLAQSKALLEGKTEAQTLQELSASKLTDNEKQQLAKHKTIPGNRPNTIIAMNELSAHSLGALIALYEHKIYAQSVLWDINAFDQWGVELGKQLSKPIFSALTENPSEKQDPSTSAWVARYKSANKK